MKLQTLNSASPTAPAAIIATGSSQGDPAAVGGPDFDDLLTQLMAPAAGDKGVKLAQLLKQSMASPSMTPVIPGVVVDGPVTGETSGKGLVPGGEPSAATRPSSAPATGDAEPGGAPTDIASAVPVIDLLAIAAAPVLPLIAVATPDASGNPEPANGSVSPGGSDRRGLDLASAAKAAVPAAGSPAGVPGGEPVSVDPTTPPLAPPAADVPAALALAPALVYARKPTSPVEHGTPPAVAGPSSAAPIIDLSAIATSTTTTDGDSSRGDAGSGTGHQRPPPVAPSGGAHDAPVVPVSAAWPVLNTSPVTAAAEGLASTLIRPADAAALGPQIVQAMSMQWQNGVGEARIRLQPEYLGELTIAIRVEGGAVTASLESGTAAVRQWLQGHESLLRQGLADQGLLLDRLSVSGESPHTIRERDQSHRQDQPPAQDHKPPRRRQLDEQTFEVVA